MPLRDWKTAARAVKHMLQPDRRVRLGSGTFLISPTAGSIWPEQDYPFLELFARGANCVYDVGAYKGGTALLMLSAMAPDGVLYAFEPVPQACGIIRHSAELNGLSDRLTIVEAPVSERSGELVGFSDQASVFNRVGDGTTLRPAIALDDVARQTGTVPDRIKVDVEGEELRVLDGMRNVLRGMRPLVFVEVHAWATSSLAESLGAVLKRATAAGYRVFWTKTGEWLMTTPGRESSDSNRTHVLLIPSESEVPELLAGASTIA